MICYEKLNILLILMYIYLYSAKQLLIIDVYSMPYFGTLVHIPLLRLCIKLYINIKITGRRFFNIKYCNSGVIGTIIIQAS